MAGYRGRQDKRRARPIIPSRVQGRARETAARPRLSRIRTDAPFFFFFFSVFVHSRRRVSDLLRRTILCAYYCPRENRLRRRRIVERENRNVRPPRFRACRPAESGGAARTSSGRSRARAPRSGTRTAPAGTSTRHVVLRRRSSAKSLVGPISRDRRGRRPSGPVRRPRLRLWPAAPRYAYTTVVVGIGQRPIYLVAAAAADDRFRPLQKTRSLAPSFLAPRIPRASSSFFFRFSLHGPVLTTMRILLRLITSRVAVRFFAPTLDHRRRPIVTRPSWSALHVYNIISLSLSIR